MATSEEMEDAREVLRLAALSLPPSDVILDLIAVGVCARCIFRLFGVIGRAYSCPSIIDALLKSFLEEPDNFQSNAGENGCTTNGATFVLCSNTLKETRNVQVYCSICLGILQFAYRDQELMKMSTNRVPVDDFTLTIAELVKKEDYHIDGFSIEVSIPPVIVANERAIGLYMKKKYESEEWFSAKFLHEYLSVKDALRTSTTALLEKHLGVVSDSNSFRIRLIYSHPEASRRLQSSLANDLSSKGAKTVMKNNVNKANDSCEGILRSSEQKTCNESDAVILRALDGIQDHVFYESFTIPPDKTFKPCHLTTTCYRMPMYIGGRYLKFSRNVSQTCWMVDDERIGEASVEEIVGKNVLSVCRGDNYKFHAAGREDIDVRMLGSGRPFLIEIANSRCMPSEVGIGLISEKINNNDQNHVRVRNLSVIGNEAWTLMREGEAEKQKQYAALVWISRSLTDGDVQNISSLKDLDIMQRTPIRVLHRRSPLERKRIIHWYVGTKS